MRRARNTATESISLRLEPGDELPGSLLAQLDEFGVHAAAVVAAAGSLDQLVYAVAARGAGGAVGYTKQLIIDGILEICSLQGHLGRTSDGAGSAHLHGVFARDDGSVIAGHVFGARTLVTVEATLLLPCGVSWRRNFGGTAGEERLPIFEPLQEEK